MNLAEGQVDFEEQEKEWKNYDIIKKRRKYEKIIYCFNCHFVL